MVSSCSSAIQEVVDVSDAYSLVIVGVFTNAYSQNGNVLVTIDKDYYPDEDEENALLMHDVSVDEFIASKADRHRLTACSFNLG